MRVASGLGVLVAGCLLAVVVGATTGDEDSSRDPEPIHSDPELVESGLIDAVLGFVNGDLDKVREGLGAIEAGCRRLEPTPEMPSEVSGYDRAFHNALTRTREQAARGDYERSFDQFFWIQKGCHECHRRAAEHGLRPEETPPSTGEDSD